MYVLKIENVEYGDFTEKADAIQWLIENGWSKYKHSTKEIPEYYRKKKNSSQKVFASVVLHRGLDAIPNY